MSHTLNLIAYTSQFIGTGIIFKFGVPTVTDTGGKMSLLLEQEDEEEKKKIKNYKYLGMFGLGLIAVGFFLQIIGELSFILI